MTRAIVIGSGPAAAFAVKNLCNLKEVLVIEKGSYNGKLKNLSKNLICNIGRSNSLKLAEIVGGASNYWGGGFIRYDKIDFNENKIRANEKYINLFFIYLY